MAIDGEARETKIESDDTLPRTEGAGAATPRASRTGIVLVSLAGLIIIAGLIYYFAEHRRGTEVAGSGSAPSESRTTASNARAPENPEQPASPTPQQQTSAQPPSPPSTDPQQSAGAPPPPPFAETPASPPEATAAAPATPANPPASSTQETATNSPPSENAAPADSAKAPQSSEPAAGSEASTPGQSSSMRNQQAALPDQQAAAPKKENMLIVMRGPAKIRSEPGKKGRVIGSVPKNATVKELDRSGKWVQVETEAGTGWINAALLSSAESR